MDERVWMTGYEDEHYPIDDDVFAEMEAAALRVDGDPNAMDMHFARLYRYLGCNSFCEHLEIDPCPMLRITLVDDAWRRAVTDDETRYSEENTRCRNLGEIKDSLMFDSFGLGFADLEFKQARGRIFGHMLEVTLFEVAGGVLTLERDQIPDAPRFEVCVESLDGL